MKEECKYLAFDGIDCNYEEFTSIEEAREYLRDCFLDDLEGYHPDANTCKIYKLIEEVVITTIDSKENYKYGSEDEAIEAEDDVALWNEDYWPHDNCFDFLAKHEFKEIK